MATIVVIRLDEITIVDEEFLKTYALALMYWIVKAASCLVFLGFFLSFMLRYFNRTSRIHGYLAAASYRVYLVHIAVVSCVQFAFLKMPELPPYVTLLGTIVVSLAVTYCVVAALTVPAQWYARVTSAGVRRQQMLEPQPDAAVTG